MERQVWNGKAIQGETLQAVCLRLRLREGYQLSSLLLNIVLDDLAYLLRVGK